MADLAEFLGVAARTPFVWGTKDCLLWPADWAMANRGVDLAHGFRGRYATALGAIRLLNREGGLLALSERQALACGLQPTEQPKPGSIGIVQVLTAVGVHMPMGGVFTGRRWSVLTAKGVVAAPFPVLKAWEV